MIQAMLRLFVGVLLPADIRSHARVFGQPLENNPGLRWLPPESLHITLKFLGPVDNKNVSKIQPVLADAVSRHALFALSLTAGGVFPSRRSPKIFWTGVSGNVPALRALAESIETALVPLGIAAEARKFTPHLTLAKIRPNIVPPAILSRQFCTLFSGFLSPEFLVNEVHLIQSHLNAGGSTASGSTYETLKSFSLARS